MTDSIQWLRETICYLLMGTDVLYVNVSGFNFFSDMVFDQWNVLRSLVKLGVSAKFQRTLIIAVQKNWYVEREL